MSNAAMVDFFTYLPVSKSTPEDIPAKALDCVLGELVTV
jgi:hypothetical protein